MFKKYGVPSAGGGKAAGQCEFLKLNSGVSWGTDGDDGATPINWKSDSEDTDDANLSGGTPGHEYGTYYLKEL